VISATHVPPTTSGAQRERKEVFLELHCCFENTTLPSQHEYSPVKVIPILHSVFESTVLMMLVELASWSFWFGE